MHRWSIAPSVFGLLALVAFVLSPLHRHARTAVGARQDTLAAQRTHAAHGAPLAAPAAPRLRLTDGSTLEDLGTLGGGSSRAWGISPSGHVVGQAIASAGVYHAFRYVGAMSDLGGPGDLSGVAAAANSADAVVGWAASLEGSTRAFLCAGGARQTLGTLGGSDSQAYAINDRGQVVGCSQTATGEEHAFLYSGGAMKDLGTLGGDDSRAYGLNNAGHVVGCADTAERIVHAFLYSDGTVRDLGTLGGNSSEAHGINSSGQVVGWASTSTGALHAFLCRGGRMRDLGTLGGAVSQAYAINRASQVVGCSATAEGRPHAFLATEDEMADLNRLLPAGCGWELVEASAINDAGQIAGSGLFHGQRRAFRLTPGASPAAIPAGTTRAFPAKKVAR